MPVFNYNNYIPLINLHYCVLTYFVLDAWQSLDKHFFQELINTSTQVTAAGFPYSNSCPKNAKKCRNPVEKKRIVPKKRAQWRRKRKRRQCHRTFQPVKLMLKWTRRIPTKARKTSCNWSFNVMYTFKRFTYFGGNRFPILTAVVLKMLCGNRMMHYNFVSIFLPFPYHCNGYRNFLQICNIDIQSILSSCWSI